MASVRILLGIICLIILGGAIEPQRNYVIDSQESNVRQRLIAIAQSQLGVREATGNNDGLQVEKYLAVVGLKRGAKWCAALVSWDFAMAGYAVPRTAWSPDLFPLAKRVPLGKPGDVYGIYSTVENRIVHCGLEESIKNDWVVGIEGNTNLNNSTDGDGVYRKRRHLKLIKYFANWLQKKGAANE